MPRPVVDGGLSRDEARVALGVAYDGSSFHGFSAQPGLRTVGGVLAAALTQAVGHDVRLTCAGRTDAGVHAQAQVVHVDLDAAALERRFGGARLPGWELPGLAKSLTGLCGDGVVVWRAVIVPARFDARRSATSRRYSYEIGLGERIDPLRRGSVWHVGGSVDLAVLRLATEPIVGEHDFAAFCRRPPDRLDGPLVRRVLEATWTRPDAQTLRFEIEAGAFCHQMVRSLVGALVAAGAGRIRPGDVVALLRSASRVGAPTIAPPHGLCLVAVRYAGDLGGTWS